jgi:hypothetical protein
MRKVLEIGGIVAGVILIAFGIAAIVLAINGRNTVSSELKDQQITGTPDMASDSAAIKGEVAAITASQKALVAKFKAASETFTPTTVTIPGCSVAGKRVEDGTSARCFAQYMFIHAMGATGGLVYSQMGRYPAKPGTPFKYTDGAGGISPSASPAIVAKYAVTNPVTKQPADNGLRSVWIDQVALSTALNASYMADQLGLFGLVVGIALLLAGFGFGILALLGALRNPDSLIKLGQGGKKASTASTPTTQTE